MPTKMRKQTNKINRLHIPNNRAAPSQILKLFEDSGQNFSIEITGGSVTIKTGSELKMPPTIVSSSDLSAKELQFIKRVKEFAKATYKDKTPYTAATIKYFGFSGHKPGIYHDVIELDINAAYWNTALKLGYISDKIHADGLTMTKRARLIALGSMATNKKLFEYDQIKKEYKEAGEICDVRLRSFFFHIAYDVGSKVKEFSDLFPDSTFFFWVDALFVLKSVAPICISKFKSYGLELKNKEIHTLEIVKGDPSDYHYRVTDIKGGIRNFICNRGKKGNLTQLNQFKRDVQEITKS